MSSAPRQRRHEQLGCRSCPANRLPVGEFDVAPGPGPRFVVDPACGHRVDIDSGVPTCVHPYRVGLPPGRYASQGIRIDPDRQIWSGAGDLQVPADPLDLEGWLAAVLSTYAPQETAQALARAEELACRRHPQPVVVAAMRRVLAVESTTGSAVRGRT